MIPIIFSCALGSCSLTHGPTTSPISSIITPDDYTKWFLFADSLGQTGELLSQIKAQRDAHVDLGSSSIQPEGREVKENCEVVIGAWANTYSELRLESRHHPFQCQAGNTECVGIPGSPLSADEFRTFHLIWTETTLRLDSWNGEVFISMLEHDISSAKYNIDRALVMTGYGSPGEWRLLKSNPLTVNKTLVVTLSPTSSPVSSIG
jgi:hypothetical protein